MRGRRLNKVLRLTFVKKYGIIYIEDWKGEKINMEISNKSIDEVKENLTEVWEDTVNHPSHYTDGGIEVIDFIKAKNLDFCLGNAVKYISRAGKKSDAALTEKEKTVEDLKKSIWYIKKEIEWLKGD